MDDTEMEGPQEPGELDDALLKAISHPLRHRLLGMLDGRVASPNELARELGLPPGRVSYPIPPPPQLGALELGGAQPRRGAAASATTSASCTSWGPSNWCAPSRAAGRSSTSTER